MSAEKYPDPVVLNASGKHTATVIFLHGLGDTGHGWSYAFQQIKSPHVKCICPTASTMKVAINMNFKMPSWFNIFSLQPGGQQDEEGIKEGCKYLNKLIAEEEKNGIPANRIVIGGFSQGGALSLYSALTSDKTFAGVLALSSWLPLHSEFLSGKNSVGNKETPVLQCHGDADQVVSFNYGKETSRCLNDIGFKNHEFKTYHNLGHNSNEEEISYVREWLKKVLPAAD